MTLPHKHALPIQTNDYYPFGLTFNEYQNQEEQGNDFLFNGKELQTDLGLDWYDYGARMYDASIGRWYSTDNKAGKYFQISPYVYVANNPLVFIDPDGNEIQFAKGVSNEFKKQFGQAVQYLNKNGAGGILASLHSSSTVYYIKGTTGTSNYAPKDKTINWNPTGGVITYEGVILSPTTVLNHEADHANQGDKNPEQKKIDKATKDTQYKNKEEKRVITGSEQETAKKLGEIKEGEVTRKDHGGNPYPTKGPTTTEGVNEIVITPTEEMN